MRHLKFFCIIEIHSLNNGLHLNSISKLNLVSDEGKIHKIVQWTRNGDSQSALLDIFDVTPDEPIQVNYIVNL